jgi:hypothetical protein
MATVKTYEGVTEAMLAYMKRNGTAAGTKYDPPEGNRGTATSKVPVFGNLVVAFELDPATQVISYEIKEKPGTVPEALVWGRITQAVEDCKATNS